MRTIEQILTRAAHAFGAEVMYVPRVRLLDRDSNIHKKILEFSKKCHSTYKQEVLLGIGRWSERYNHLFKHRPANRRRRRLKYPEISAAKGAYVAVAFEQKSQDRRHSTHKTNEIKVVAFASVRTFHWYNTVSYFKAERKGCRVLPGSIQDKCKPQALLRNEFLEDDIPIGRKEGQGRILELHLVATAVDRNNVAKDYGRGLGKIVAMLIVNKMQGVQLHRSGGANPRFRYKYLLAEQVVDDLGHVNGGATRYKWEDLFNMVNAVKLEQCDNHNQDVEFRVKNTRSGITKKFCPSGELYKKNGDGEDGNTIYWGRKRPTSTTRSQKEEKYFLLSLGQVKDNIIGAKLTSQRRAADPCKRQPLGDFRDHINRPKSYLKWYKKARKRARNNPAEGGRKRRDRPLPPNVNNRKRPRSKGCT